MAPGYAILSLMKMIIISVGGKTDSNLNPVIDYYLKRLNIAVEWVLLDPPKGDLSVAERRDAETNLMLVRLAKLKSIFSILLDETGENISSPQLAKKIESAFNQSLVPVFIIGGAFGVNEACKQKVDFVWSLSKLVFPHQLVRLILVEQIYRAKSIIDNRAYHHL